MLSKIKKAIKSTVFYNLLWKMWMLLALWEWYLRGEPNPPPPPVKQNTVKEYAVHFNLSTLIETGTYLGDMIRATGNCFDRIFSVELNETLYEKAKKKFSKFSHIRIIKGNSSKVLPDLLRSISQPCLFWLDAHEGNKDTPVTMELKSIFSHSASGYVILIDDARFFVGRNNYPTIEELKEFVRNYHTDWVVEIKHDIIRIHPALQDIGATPRSGVHGTK
ncbi:MAG: hypothetical protein ABIH68_04055 [bacterium]